MAFHLFVWTFFSHHGEHCGGIYFISYLVLWTCCMRPTCLGEFSGALGSHPPGVVGWPPLLGSLAINLYLWQTYAYAHTLYLFYGCGYYRLIFSHHSVLFCCYCFSVCSVLSAWTGHDLSLKTIKSAMKQEEHLKTPHRLKESISMSISSIAKTGQDLKKGVLLGNAQTM